jgi:heat shock protein 90kDa beta
MDEDVASQIEKSNEEFSFNADIARLMDIIINSLYTKKEVFIRELISNASDALDKVRFVSVQNPEFLGTVPQLEIMIDFDYDAKTISITDTGIGMTKAELIKNLGTVAKSGTTAFLEAMGKGDSLSLIGQFGVGFYSAFLVANKVVVSSKANDDEQHVWTSTADAKFFVTKDPRGDTLGRGTRVTLHLKDDAIEFVEQDKIKNLVKKYSEFIQYPIKLFLSKEVRKTVPADEEKPAEEKPAETPATDDAEIKDEGETKPTEEAKPEEPKTKTVTEQVWEWENINEVKAIWLREKSDITDEEYNNFYKTISKDHENPLAYTHFSAEGEIEFKAILFIPANAPYDLFENYYGKSSALKLYVRRVLITEEFEELMPRYLNFIKGIVDSDDLPLNVSREQLQQLKMIKVMSKKLIRKAIEMIKEIADDSDEGEDDDDSEDTEESAEEAADEEKKEKSEDEEKKDEEAAEDKYGKFWKNFGKNIKLGVIEDASNRSKLAKLLRFHSTHDTEKLTSLDEYISRMKADQDTILYLPGDSKEAILKSPILKKYQKLGYEILLLGDPIDEFCVQHLSEYEKRKVKSIAKDDVNILDGNDEVAKKKLQKLKEMYKPLTEWFKKHLGKEVEKVTISNKLEDDPVFILTSQYGYSAQMEKINRAQAFANQEKAASYMLAKKTLELNPHHPVIKEMLQRVKADENADEETREYGTLLYNMALLNSGFLIENPTEFIIPMQKLLKVGFGIRKDAPVEEIEVDISSSTADEEQEQK